MKKKVVRALALGALLMTFVPATVFADENSAKNVTENATVNAEEKTVTVDATEQNVVVTDAVQNRFFAGQNGDITGDALDVCGAGYQVTAHDMNAAGNLAIAGYEVGIENANVGGTVYGAGYSVDLDNVQVGNNVIAVGYSVKFDENSKAKTVRAAGQNVTLDGETDYAYLSGEIVEINGIIHKDAEVEADKIIIGDDARIEGNLKLSATEEPDGAKGLVEGSYEFEQIVRSADEAEEPSFAEKAAKTVKGRIYWIIAMVLVGLLLLLVANRNVDELSAFLEGPNAKTSGLKFAGFGLLGLLVTPIAILLMAITFVGLPAAGFVLVIYLLILALSQTFTGLVVGRLAFRRFIPNKYVSSLIGVATLVILDAIPVVSLLVGIMSGIVTFGYLAMALGNARSGAEEVQTSPVVEATDSETVEAETTGAETVDAETPGADASAEE